MIEKILKTALKYGASDVFLATGSKPTLKINGTLIQIEQLQTINEEIFEEFLNYFAQSDQITRFKTDKDIDFSAEVEEYGRFRVNLFRQRSGASMVLRPIPQFIKGLEDLHLPKILKNLIHQESGLILLTGPTGSGKSTTLAAMINEINENSSKHIITVEDPIEFIHPHKKSLVEQREVGSHTKSCAEALRASLRGAPDVILVGEMRDLDTIALAITAAETGHLVLATLHTSGAPHTIDRIIDVFPPNQQSQIRTQLAMSLNAVIWQKLIKTADKSSRIPAVEILINTPAVSNLIRKGGTHQMYGSMETGMQDGMQTMTMCLRDFVNRGLITPEQADLHLGISKDINT